MIKKNIVLSGLLFFSLSVLPVFSNPAEVWSRLYRRSNSLEQKEMVLENIVKLNDRAVEPILMEALEEMNNNQEKFRGDRALMMKWVEMTNMIVKSLGDLKTRDAEDLVWFVVNHPADDSLLKANALMALGEMRATTYASEIATMLRNLNFNTQQDNLVSAEIEAYACVSALQKMRDPVGFEPVFYAATGWYSKRTKTLALASLSQIAMDPTEPVMKIMKDADFSTKRTALLVEKESEAPQENKTKVAVLALDEGLKYSTTDKKQQDELSKLRIDAMKTLIQSNAKDNAAVPLLKTTIERSNDANETIYAYYALGVIASDEAVDVLSANLVQYNTRQSDGIAATQEQLGFVKQIINSIGMSGNSRGMASLTEVQFSNYTPAINRLAKQAMEKLK
ncbi:MULTISPECIES: hypothetical protein [unclassified Oceanispirochaeta]|uniref:hypothetical protein n=1 Tax=unclassified Oceanispirochaeta TaxID=2635722 RepID=UPI000E09BECC|nr:MULTISPECIES: hypothetical protein [unclassified Oceanispirochaeta]MBF9015701.1 hypothetical protein [Oceanispirochaeta sp. M2]NPD72166.1 hypothetical protein [Oceanispirochaeta sp. M1]RDG32265.1 hypothetical protein DV872_08650 [Oceanispirochaeta sp. M1]